MVADEAPHAARSRPRRLRRGIVVSLVTLVVLLAFGELWTRVTNDRERAYRAGVNRTSARWVALLSAGIFEEIDDPVRRYRMRPGAECVVDGWRFTITRHATRGEDFSLEKPPGEKRILCLGDSFAFGLWCDDDETLVGHLARLANEDERARGSDTTWRAVNLGVPGYNSRQQLRALEQDGLALEPDVVVLYYNTNDIACQGFFLDEELRVLRSDHTPLPVSVRKALWNSHLYGAFVRRYERRWSGDAASYLDAASPWSYASPANLACTRAAIERIAAHCRERGIPLFFVNQPLMSWSGDTRSDEWTMLPMERWARELRAELGIPGFDMLGLLRNYPDGVDRFPEPPAEGFLVERYFADETVQAYFAGDTSVELPPDPDFHLTGEGYGHLARLVYPAMVAAGVLER